MCPTCTCPFGWRNQDLKCSFVCKISRRALRPFFLLEELLRAFSQRNDMSVIQHCHGAQPKSFEKTETSSQISSVLAVFL